MTNTEMTGTDKQITLACEIAATRKAELKTLIDGAAGKMGDAELVVAKRIADEIMGETDAAKWIADRDIETYAILRTALKAYVAANGCPK